MRHNLLVAIEEGQATEMSGSFGNDFFRGHRLPR